MYHGAELKISETEVVEILKTVSDVSRLESNGSSGTIVHGTQSPFTFQSPYC